VGASVVDVSVAVGASVVDASVVRSAVFVDPSVVVVSSPIGSGGSVAVVSAGVVEVGAGVVDSVAVGVSVASLPPGPYPPPRPPSVQPARRPRAPVAETRLRIVRLVGAMVRYLLERKWERGFSGFSPDFLRTVA
jgi:hypothetical protein